MYKQNNKNKITIPQLREQILAFRKFIGRNQSKKAIDLNKPRIQLYQKIPQMNKHPQKDYINLKKFNQQLLEQNERIKKELQRQKRQKQKAQRELRSQSQIIKGISKSRKLKDTLKNQSNNSFRVSYGQKSSNKQKSFYNGTDSMVSKIAYTENISNKDNSFGFSCQKKSINIKNQHKPRFSQQHQITLNKSIDMKQRNKGLKLKRRYKFDSENTPTNEQSSNRNQQQQIKKLQLQLNSLIQMSQKQTNRAIKLQLRNKMGKIAGTLRHLKNLDRL